jgi:hypothetical protein
VYLEPPHSLQRKLSLSNSVAMLDACFVRGMEGS